MPKILCPLHNDSKPSMEVYPDGRGYCFVCKGSINVENNPKAKPKKKAAEDLKLTLSEISTLPVKRVRGLELLADFGGYYVVWPDHSYYKYRFWNPTTQGKYKGPTGHKQPLLVLEGTSEELYIVEGEINALSVKQALPSATVITAGSASNTSTLLDSILNYAAKYAKVVMYFDSDFPGLEQVLVLAPQLLLQGKVVSYIRSEKDANEHLLCGTLTEVLNETKAFRQKEV